MMAQAILGLKAAADKAQAEEEEARPASEIVAALESLDVRGPGGHGAAWRWARATRPCRRMVYRALQEGRRQGDHVENVVRYPAECVNPPDGMRAEKWIEARLPRRQVLS